MLSKRVTKIVQNLEKKKFREKYNLYKVEGNKLVQELLITPWLTIDTLIATKEWIDANIGIKNIREIVEATDKEISSISNFQSAPDVIALVEIPKTEFDPKQITTSLSVVLNGIQDPGNFGTIMRVADWFGIKNIFCDIDCASQYNPKAIQSSMGAVFRVKVHYTDLEELFKTYCNNNFKCYGTFLNGESIYKTNLADKGFIVMGNEGHGISPTLEPFITERLTIPSFAQNELSTESLNVGVATGIILSEFKRNH
ncbi:MAG: RNA methyltransferase [Marinifilaceae bacterium]